MVEPYYIQDTPGVSLLAHFCQENQSAVRSASSSGTASPGGLGDPGTPGTWTQAEEADS